MSSFGWGIVGPGRIAHRFAEAVTRLPATHIAAVQARDPGRAAQFIDAWPQSQPQPQPQSQLQTQSQPPTIHQTLDTLLADPAVDAVYIATPHAFHAQAVRAALQAGKPVLCEKPLAPTATLARELGTLSRARGVFLMEALWSRFLPVYADVGGWLASGAIGAVRGIQSSFCFTADYDPASRMFDPALAGGALLDLGVYNLSLSQWVMRQAFGACPAVARIDAHGVLAPTGVDQHVAATLVFEGGVCAQFQCGFIGRCDGTLRILGERGHIVVPARFHEAIQASLHVADQAPVHVDRPFQINGFEGEIVETMRCVAAGKIESKQMPQSDTLAVAEWMDAIRARIGVRYPFD